MRTENHGLRFFGKWDEDYTDNYQLKIGSQMQVEYHLKAYR